MARAHNKREQSQKNIKQPEPISRCKPMSPYVLVTRLFHNTFLMKIYGILDALSKAGTTIQLNKNSMLRPVDYVELLASFTVLGPRPALLE